MQTAEYTRLSRPHSPSTTRCPPPAVLSESSLPTSKPLFLYLLHTIKPSINPRKWTLRLSPALQQAL